jgi:hypothetical protein
MVRLNHVLSHGGLNLYSNVINQCKFSLHGFHGALL